MKTDRPRRFAEPLTGVVDVRLRRSALALALGLALLVCPGPSFAAGASMGGMGGGLRGGGGYRAITVGSYLIVAAQPLEAQVFLDRHLLGTARDLMVHAVAVGPGRHALEIVAPGFSPYITEFTAYATGFSTRLRVELARE
jgi:hypothetical protein